MLWSVNSSLLTGGTGYGPADAVAIHCTLLAYIALLLTTYQRISSTHTWYRELLYHVRSNIN